MNFFDILHNQVFVGGFMLLVSGAVMALCRRIPAEAWFWIRRRFVASVEITDETQTHHWFNQWFDAHPYSKRTKLLSVWNDYSSNPALLRFSPGPGTHFITHGGRIFVVTKQKTRIEGGLQIGGWKESVTIQTLAWSQEPIRDLLREIEEVGHEKNTGKIEVYSNVLGNWFRVAKKAPRPLESVILPKGMRESIVSKLDSFFASKDFYDKLAVPYRVGVLFYGVPGSGKSSLVEALAGHYGKNVYVLGLAAKGLTDERLTELFRDVPPGDFVLIEDVDAAWSESRKKREGADGVTFSGLLNALDGIAAKEGRVLFMTTNHRDKLDPALIRSGRVDHVFEFGFATVAQLAELYRRFYPSANGEAERFARNVENASMADAQCALLDVRARDSGGTDAG